MLKALLKKQFRELGQALFPSKKDKNGTVKSRKAVYIVLYVFVFISVTASFFGLAAMLSAFLDPEVGLAPIYFAILGLVAIFFGVFGSVFSTYASLYLAKDNDTLLAMPIPPAALLFSRMLTVFVMGAIYILPAWIPAVVVYMTTLGFSLPAFLCQLIVYLLLCIFVCFLSAFLGFVVAVIASRLKNKSVAVAILSVVFFAAYYFICFRAGAAITLLLERANEVGAFIDAHLPFLGWLGEASCGKVSSLLLFGAIVIALFALLYFVLSKTFLSISTRKSGDKKAVYREKEARAGSVSSALFQKEWKRFVGSAAYLLNAGFGVIIVLVFTVILAVKTSDLLSAFGEMGVTFLLPILIYALPAMMLGMNGVTAPSISLEGKTLWQLKSLPVTPWQVLKAKLALHIVVNAPFGLLSTLFLGIWLGVDLLSTILATLCVLGVIFFSALWGLFWGLKRPMLDWTNETIPIKQSAPVAFAVFGAMLLVILTAIPGAYFAAFLHPAIYFAALLVLFAAACAPLLHWTKTKGARLFEEL